MAPKEERLAQDEAMKKIKSVVGLVFPIVVSAIYMSYNYVDWDMPSLKTPSERVIYTLQWHCLSGGLLFTMIANVANERSIKAWNPLDPKNQGNTEVLNRILSNTVEQFLVFFPLTLVLSTYLHPSQMKSIPILVVTWVLGRLAFQYGYIVSPLYRSPGMAMTMLANLLSLIGVFYHVYTQGPMVMAIIMSFFVLKTFYNFLANFLKTPFFL